jgi:integrase
MKLQELRAEAATTIVPTGLLVEQLFERMLAATSAASNTMRIRKRSAKIVVGKIGHLRVQGITFSQLADLLDQLAAGGTKPNILLQVHAVLRKAFGFAIEREVIAKDPTTKLKRPKVTPKQIDPFTIEEVLAIRAAAVKERMGFAMETLFLTGLRQGELFGLKWQDVDWQARRLKVVRQALWLDDGMKIVPVKSKSSNRTLPISDDLYGVLNARSRKAREEGFDGEDDFVFPTQTGAPFNATTFREKAWSRTLGNAGVRYRGGHHARHSFATFMLQAGVPVQVVSALLGHSSPTITLKTYAHVLPRADHAAMASLETLIGCSAVATRTSKIVENPAKAG